MLICVNPSACKQSYKYHVIIVKPKKCCYMISIVMPTHVKPPLLVYTLISVLSQKYDDFEFIIVDASQDKYFIDHTEEFFSHAYLLPYQKNFNKVKVVRPEHDYEFPGAMKMFGVSNCVQDDDFVVFLDHDDFLGNYLLHHMSFVKTQYPSTEMVSTNYTSMTYNCMCNSVFTNIETYAGGTPCGSTDTIYIDNHYFKFDSEFDIYKNIHAYKAAMCPKIMSKKTIREKRFSFIEDTRTLDDVTWPIQSHSFTETYIPIIGYVYIGYSGGYTSTSGIGYPTSETASKAISACFSYGEYLDSIGYEKHRNELLIKNI